MDHMDMEMSGGSSMSMDSSSMSMVFFSATNTPLFSSAWTPSSSGAYAGTCIFLIVLSIILRSLFAFKTYLEYRWLEKARARRYVVVADKTPEAERVGKDNESQTAILTTNGVEEKVMVVHKPVRQVQPWRFSVDLPRAFLVFIISGVGYLLMLAVMTMNVGYFMSVLAGVFIGELAFGRYSQAMDDHHAH